MARSEMLGFRSGLFSLDRQAIKAWPEDERFERQLSAVDHGRLFAL
jgi:hypothetical protein